MTFLQYLLGLFESSLVQHSQVCHSLHVYDVTNLHISNYPLYSARTVKLAETNTSIEPLLT